MSTSIVNGQVILEEEDIEYEPTDEGVLCLRFFKVLALLRKKNTKFT